MNEMLALTAPLAAGAGLGAIFFGGLWLTVRRAMGSPRVALWFFGSLLLRMGIALGGFYLVCGSDWRRWLAALLGFVLARAAVTRLTRPAEARHAP